MDLSNFYLVGVNYKKTDASTRGLFAINTEDNRSLLQAANHGQVTSQWNPLTLQGAGLFHMAMGAVMGVAAYGRTREKIAGMVDGQPPQ